MVNSKRSKVFYFVCKPGLDANLEMYICHMSRRLDKRPRIFSERLIMGTFRDGECFYTKYNPNFGERVHGFVQFNRAVNPETEPSIKHMRIHFVSLFVPYDGSDDFKCSKAFDIPREHLVTEVGTRGG